MRLSKLFFCVSLGGLSAVAQAVCPLCTLAVSAGVGLTQYLGIDDLITGLWLGGLLASLTLWSSEWLKRRNNAYSLRHTILLTIGWFGSCYFALWIAGYLGHPLNRLWGVDRLLLGTIMGAVTFVLVYLGYLWLKFYYGRPLFPFQKVVMPVVALLGLSFLFNGVLI